jgi:hypothetical protein
MLIWVAYPAAIAWVDLWPESRQGRCQREDEFVFRYPRWDVLCSRGRFKGDERSWS